MNKRLPVAAAAQFDSATRSSTPTRPGIYAALALAATLALVLAPRALAVTTFTKITDPTNPVVTEQHESAGASWVDLNGDGLLDLFVGNGNSISQNNSLYRNIGGGQFVRVVTGPVVSDGGKSLGGTFGDFDNDGILDLFVTNRNNFGNFFYHGLGDTSFSKVTTGQPATDVANSNSSSWVDLNNDGLLDLYVANFQGNDFLYLNGGGPGFALTRIDTAAFALSGDFNIPAAWADYNNDGLQDLFEGNAGTQADNLFVNHGNLNFTKIILGDNKNSLGGSWGDYDNDGYLDLVTASYQNGGNLLYHNSGPPNYFLSPVSTSVFPGDSAFSVGSCWGDYDNDGALDLYIANDGQPGFLYHNSGPPNYTLTKVTTGSIVTDVANSFGCVWGDYDGDGQLDLFIANHVNQKNGLYHNNGNSNHWVTYHLVGTSSNRTAIGAKVWVSAVIGGALRHQVQEVTGQCGYNCQNLDLHFGLGDATSIDFLKVEWPSGRVEVAQHVAADARITLTEGFGNPAAVAGAADSRMALAGVGRNPCMGAPSVSFSLASGAPARLEMLDVSGRRIRSREVGSMGPGRHRIDLAGEGTVPSGLYFVRLTSGRDSQTVKFVVAR